MFQVIILKTIRGNIKFFPDAQDFRASYLNNYMTDKCSCLNIICNSLGEHLHF